METKLNAYEWCDVARVRILDPDGWRYDDGVTMDTPITAHEFLDRLRVSTVQNLVWPGTIEKRLWPFL